MGWHIIHLTDVAATPWRNGGGVTRELAVWPPQGEWAWRMSVAEVDRSGPFSRFEGMERWLAVLQGKGVQLDVGVGPRALQPGPNVRTLTAADAPFYFDGEANTYCHLRDGPSQDFNLMVRKSAQPSRMVRVLDHYSSTVDAPKVVAVYAIGAGANVEFNQEKVYVPPATLLWRSVSKKATVRMSGAQALWIEIPG
ncbi:MAG: HutD family protein [Burkholderiales bacterium]|nr:HutD family protein [Burkholderiales bacterium]